MKINIRSSKPVKITMQKEKFIQSIQDFFDLDYNRAVLLYDLWSDFNVPKKLKLEEIEPKQEV